MTEIDNLVLEAYKHIVNGAVLSSDLNVIIKPNFVDIQYYRSGVKMYSQYFTNYTEHSVMYIEYISSRDKYFNEMMQRELLFEYDTMLRMIEILEYCGVHYKVEDEL